MHTVSTILQKQEHEVALTEADRKARLARTLRDAAICEQSGQEPTPELLERLREVHSSEFAEALKSKKAEDVAKDNFKLSVRNKAIWLAYAAILKEYHRKKAELEDFFTKFEAIFESGRYAAVCQQVSLTDDRAKALATLMPCGHTARLASSEMKMLALAEGVEILHNECEAMKIAIELTPVEPLPPLHRGNQADEGRYQAAKVLYRQQKFDHEFATNFLHIYPGELARLQSELEEAKRQHKEIETEVPLSMSQQAARDCVNLARHQLATLNDKLNHMLDRIPNELVKPVQSHGVDEELQKRRLEDYEQRTTARNKRLQEIADQRELIAKKSAEVDRLQARYEKFASVK